MDSPCGGEEDENLLNTGKVQGPLPVQGGLAASWAGEKIIGTSDGRKVLEVHWCTNRPAVSQVFSQQCGWAVLIYSFGDMKTSRWSKAHCTRTSNMVGCSMPAGCLSASGNYCLIRVFRENGKCSPLLKTSSASIRIQCVEEDGNSEEQVHLRMQ